MAEEKKDAIIVLDVEEDEEDKRPDLAKSEKKRKIREELKPGKSLHGDVLSALIRRRDAAEAQIDERRGQWRDTNNRMRMYIDLSQKAKRADDTRMDNTRDMPFDRSVVVPASYSIMHVLLTQIMSIFGQTEPLVQVRGRGPEDVARAKVLESVLAYDLDEMFAFMVLYGMCQDALKLGTGVVYDSWHTEKGEIITRYPFDAMDPVHQFAMKIYGPEAFVRRDWGIIKEHNMWTHVNPMEYFPDPRVPVSRPQDGEFVGHRFYRGWMYFKERAEEYGGPYFNVDKISRAGTLSGYNERTPDDKMPEPDEHKVDEKDGGSVEACHMQVKLIPKEWNLSDREYPEVWWFTWVNDEVIIRAHPSYYDHNEFTYAVAESDPDGHSFFNPGVVENVDGLQRMIDWMFNAHLQNLMRYLNDALIFAPTLIDEDDIVNPGPARHIRLTQLGEELLMSGGYSINNFVQQMPFQDVTSPHLGAMQQMFQFAQRMTAANDPQMGMPTPDRRTLGEIQTITASASQRISIIAKLIDQMAISKLAKRAISNRLQFTSTQQYYRVAGEDTENAEAIEMLTRRIGKMDLYGNYDYMYNTGILPPDPVRMARTWAQIYESAARHQGLLMQNMQAGFPPPDGKMPDTNAILKESFKTLGARNIDQYYVPIQVQQDQQIQQGVQQGNMVPLNQVDPNNPPPELMGG